MASVKKRTWTNKDGKSVTAWVTRWSDPNVRDEHGKPKRYQEQFRTMKEADACRRRIEMDFATGHHVSASVVITVRDLCERYIRHCEDKCRDGRIGKGRLRGISQGLTRSVIPTLGSISLSALTMSDVEGAYRKLCAPSGGRLAAVTAKQRIIFLKMAQDYAISRGFMKKRPVSDAMRELRGIRSEEIRVFTTDEIRLLLQTANQRSKHATDRATALTNCIVHLATCCGLRYGEIVGLRRKNISLAKGVISVVDNQTAFDGLKGPKTKAGLREVPLPETVFPLIRHWLENFYVENTDGLAFRTNTGGRLLYASFHTWGWRKLLKRAGLERDERPFRFHALRHHYGSALLAAGVPISDVAELMGHAKVDITLHVYAHAMMGARGRGDAVRQVLGSLVQSDAAMPEAA